MNIRSLYCDYESVPLRANTGGRKRQEKKKGLSKYFQNPKNHTPVRSNATDATRSPFPSGGLIINIHQGITNSGFSFPPPLSFLCLVFFFFLFHLSSPRRLQMLLWHSGRRRNDFASNQTLQLPRTQCAPPPTGDLVRATAWFPFAKSLLLWYWCCCWCC